VPATPPAPAAELTEPPHFATRGERKRFLRENDLPADIPTASIPIVLAQRAAGIETDSANAAHSTGASDAADAGSTPDSASSAESEAPAPAPETAPTASQDAPRGDAWDDSGSAPATPSAAEPSIPTAAETETPGTPSTTESASAATEPSPTAPATSATAPEQTDAPSASQPGAQSSTPSSAQSTGRSGSLFGSDDPVTVTTTPSSEQAAGPSGGLGSLFDTPAQTPSTSTTGSAPTTGGTTRTGAVSTGSGAPQFDLASRRVGSHATGPDFETSSTAVITPSALGDHDAPLKRRSPVVKPPTGSNIRVVTGALPIVTESDLEANPPTTPMSAIDESTTSGSRGSDTFRTSESPVFRTSRPAADPWSRLGQEDEEEDSDELEEPPARPMSARSVTNEDGSVLVAERNSMVPYIVLGVTGFAALILVIVAITLLF
jgi:hypothetical protein